MRALGWDAHSKKELNRVCALKEVKTMLWYLSLSWPDEGPLNETEAKCLSPDSEILLVADDRDLLVQFLRDGANIRKLNKDNTPVPEGAQGAFPVSGGVVALSNGQGSHMWLKENYQWALGEFCECMFFGQIINGGA